MRRPLTKAVLALLLAPACASEVVTRPSPPPVDWRSLEAGPPAPPAVERTAAGRRRAAASAYLEGLASPGFAGLALALDEEAHSQLPGAMDARGRGAVVRAHQAALGMLRDRSFVATRVLFTERSQALEWTMTGVDEATSRPVSLAGLALLWTDDDGLVSDVHLYFGQAAAPGPLPSPLQEVEQRRSPEESANVAVVRAGLRALTDGNEAAWLATMSGDVEVSAPGSAEPSRGLAAARSSFRALRDRIAYLSASLENAWGIGALVVVEYHLVGEQRRAGGGLPAQPDPLTALSLAEVVELREGKVARLWRYGDPLQPAAAP